jgi:hypothetical protein
VYFICLVFPNALVFVAVGQYSDVMAFFRTFHVHNGIVYLYICVQVMDRAFG